MWKSEQNFVAWAFLEKWKMSSFQVHGHIWGGSMWEYDPKYLQQITWAVSPGAAQPTRRSLAGHDAARRLPQDTGKIS